MDNVRVICHPDIDIVSFSRVRESLLLMTLTSHQLVNLARN